MPKSFAKIAFAAAAATCLFSQPAKAWTVKVSPDTSQFSQAAPIIDVESDGSRWTKIRSGTHKLGLRAEVDVGNAWRVHTVWMHLPNADFCRSFDTPAGCKRIFSGATKHFKKSLAYEFLSDHIGGLEALAIVNACNAGGRDAAQEHRFNRNISVGIKAYIVSRRDARHGVEPDQGRSETAYTEAPVVVRCLAPLAETEAPPKPVSVDIRAKQMGNSCPKDGEVTAYLDYPKPVTGRFRIIHNGKVGKEIEASTREVSLGGKTWYRIEHLERYRGLEPGKHNFQVSVVGGGESERRTLDVDCPPFKVTSVWLTYNVADTDTCPKQVAELATFKANGPGTAPFEIKTQGGLVVHSGTATFKLEGTQYVAESKRNVSMKAFDSEMMAEIKNQSDANSGWVRLKVDCVDALSGKLTLNSLPATACQGEALVSIHTDGAGELPYELECGPGKSWQRKVTAMANKIGVDKVRVDVTNNEHVTCVLRTRIGGVLKPLDGASKTFQCHKPVDVGASDDLVTETRPEEPPVLDTLTGDFSFVDNGGTQCPRQGKALINFKTSKPDNVHYSLDCTNGSFSGVAQTAPSPQGGYIAPALVSFAVNKTTNAKCALKTVAPGKAKVHMLKGHTFQCVRTTDVGGANDLTPDPKPDPQVPSKPVVVIDPPRPTVSCAGGAVKNGACLCEPAFKPVRAGANAWRCVRTVVDPKPVKPTVVTPPKISCAGGTVKNGACVCEPGRKPVRAGANAWRCVQSTVDPKPVKPTVSTPTIACAGGVVKNGACTCARTHKVVKAGKTAWRCVASVPPKNKLEVKTAPKKTAAPNPAVPNKLTVGTAKTKAKVNKKAKAR